VTTPSLWQPVLVDGERERAIEVIHAIAHALRDLPETELSNANLSGGVGGVSVFFCHLARWSAAREHLDLAEHFAALAMDAMDATNEPTGASLALYGGISGVAWLLRHLQTHGFEIAPDATAEVDARIIDELSQPWKGEFDLVSGLVGIGVYALEGALDERCMKILELVVERLADLAEPHATGLCWRSPVRNIEASPTALDGLYNLGVAHGTPGCIALFGALLSRGLFVERTRPLLDGAVDWLLGYEQRDRPFLRYAYNVHELTGPTRLAWCYGDPGVAAALFVAARATADDDLRGRALALARSATTCPFDQTGVQDAGICHGAAGLAHIFNRLGQAAGDEGLLAAARLWYGQALELRRSGCGIAGFQAIRAREARAAPGYLIGAAGIGLTLLSAISDAPPTWDLPLLLT
jgi:hypothetical protein